MPKSWTRQFTDDETGRRYLLFFLTDLRKDLLTTLRRVAADLLSGKISSHVIIPAGPQGVGKSLYCYMIACFAAINRFPLLYIPSPAKWFQAKTARHPFLVETFLDQNSFWLPESPMINEFIRVTSPNSDLSAEVAKQFDAQVFRGFDKGFDFEKGLPPPRFIIVDEHNELFRVRQFQTVQFRYADDNDFAPVCKPDLNAVTVLSGSSHSKFLNGLNGKYRSQIIPLQPFSRDETICFISHPNSPCRIPELTTDDLEKVALRYGGMPRVLTSLKADILDPTKGFRLFGLVTEETGFGTRLNLFLATQVSSPWQENAFSQAVRHSLLKSDGLLQETEPYTVLDPGLFYRNHGQWHPINKHAADLILKKYAELEKIRPLKELEDTNPAACGHEFQNQVILGMVHPEFQLRFHSHFERYSETVSYSVQSFETGRIHIHPFQGMDFEELQGLRLRKELTLLYPLDFNFPRVDFLLMDFRNPGDQVVYLLQVTITNPIKHRKKNGDWIGFFASYAKWNEPSSSNSSSSTPTETSSIETWPDSCGSDSEDDPDSQKEDEEDDHAAPSSSVGKASWNRLAEILGFPASTTVKYIYVTSSKMCGTARVNKGKIPSNVSICVMPRKHLKLLNVVI